MNSPFVSSPGILSPGMEFPHGLGDFGLNEMVMSPLGQGQAGSMNPQQSQHPHHQLQTLQSHGLSPQHLQANLGLGQQAPNMGAISPQSLQGHQGMSPPGLPTSHPMSGGGNAASLMGRQPPPPPRANSFAMVQQPSIPRTVGDFHALQRANSESSSTMTTLAGMATLGTEMDFGGLR
jgi:hypothetical protein